MDNLDKILEGLLFVSGDGLEKGFIMEKLGVTDKEITKALDKLKEKYSNDCGIHLITYKNKIQMSSNPAYADDIALVLNPIRERNLSKATLETVAIIAYKQPITRLEIEEIRGVNSDYALQTLMNLKMIEVVGRKDAIGKPLLFGVTEEFLKRFDLQSINDLPDYDELLKSIQVIEQENNHLYNEFEIPDEEQKEDNETQNNKNENTNTVEFKNTEENQIETGNSNSDFEANKQSDNITKIENDEEILQDDFDELPDFLKNEKNLQKIGD